MARIVIVEDKILIGMMLVDWLADLGHWMMGPAKNVGKALGLIERALPDGAIIDIILREQTGYPVAEVLSARGVPFAVATGRPVEAIEAPSPT